MQYCPECKLPLAQPAARCPSCDADLTHVPVRLAKAYPPPPKTEPNQVEEVRKAVRASPPTTARGTMIESVEQLRAVPVSAPAGKAVSETAAPNTRAPNTARPKSAAAKPPVARSPAERSPAETIIPPTVAPPESPGDRDTKAVPTQPPQDTREFRPLNRPPMAIVIALDDGSRDAGEIWRVRQSPFSIGRTSGEAIISHDSEISGRHAQLSCRAEGGGFHWYLSDLQSTNGTFLRVSRVVLREGLQFLIGTRRYEYRGASLGNVPSSSDSGSGIVGAAASTSRFQVPSSASIERMDASFVEITPAGDGRRYPLPATDALVGSGRQCGVQILGDLFVSPVHAKLTIDGQKRRFLENQNSLNGLWVRIQEERIDQNCEFQCGEQRFLVRFP